VVLGTGRHDPVTDLFGVAVVVDVEQLRCQRVAPVVTLTLLRIDVDSHGRLPIVNALPPKRRAETTGRATSARRGVSR
jgi:hypothetical protein